MINDGKPKIFLFNISSIKLNSIMKIGNIMEIMVNFCF